MTREHADAVLYLVDQLRARGASLIEVEGIKAGFPGPAVPPPAADKPASRRKEKSYDERLFGRLPKREAR